MKTEAARVGHIVDLTNCDREPIHIPEYIQPHGLLLVLQKPDLVITTVSDNAQEHIGVDSAGILGSNLSQYLDAETFAEIKSHLISDDPGRANPMRVRIGEKVYDAIAHKYLGNLILELEPAQSFAGDIAVQFYNLMRNSMGKFRGSNDLKELCEAAVREIRRITGYDRVVIYRFDRDWNGLVIAEERDEKAESYLGLNFPSSDIPRQARELYAKNWLRIIPNVDYRPARLLHLKSETSPIDLSFSVLRSVSPIHIEYLHNMGVSGSMSVSLISGDRLWGLISCTHLSGAKYVPFEVRAACHMIAEVMSSLLSVREESETSDYRIHLKSVHGCLLQYMSQTPDLVYGLVGKKPNILDQANAQGAVIFFDGEYTMVGQTPNDAQVADLIEWLSQKSQTDVLCTDSLPSLYPPAEAYKDVACGMLALSLSKGRNNYVLWFRPEVVQTVNWSGNPTKPVENNSNNPTAEVRLHPRKSFELWKEVVQNRSLPWLDVEREAALDLRDSMVDIILQKAEEISKLNVELERSNIELDSFAYAASHDLKEPLRGIHNYANLVLRQAGSVLDDQSGDRMKTIVRLTQRMEGLINSLLYYSQVGRMDLSMRTTDLNDVLSQVLDGLRHLIDQEQVEIRLPKRLPSVQCDRVRIAEVFSNLIVNALKYNDKEKKWVEINFEDAGRDKPPVFYVRDNGIGIREKHFDSIFRIFKRLHGRDEYGGGTGTGLTITRRIIERHNGRLWVESKLGEGTTFYFTIGEHPLSEAQS